MLRCGHYGKSPADIRRKSYIITDTGRQMLKDEYERLKTMVRDGERCGEIERGNRLDKYEKVEER